jgi:hypothetical protein
MFQGQCLVDNVKLLLFVRRFRVSAIESHTGLAAIVSSHPYSGVIRVPNSRTFASIKTLD